MIRPLSVPILLAALTLSGSAPAVAQQPLLPLGLARRDITPNYPIRLSGYSNRDQEFEGIEQRIGCKALAIGSGPQTAVLITVDSLGISSAMTDEVAARLAKRASLARERLAICASHTHSAPALPSVAGLIFSAPLNDSEREHMARYERELTDHLEQVALDALAARQPGHLSWAQGSVGFAANRRVLKEGRWTGFGVAPEGPVDHALPVLRVSDSQGKLRGLLANYACHCTTLGGKFNKVCGDWAGFAQEILEREYPGAVAMISIGCGADANPNPRGDDLALCLAHGEAIAREVKRLLESTWTPLPGVAAARLERIELPFDTLPTREEFAQRAAQKGPIAWHAQAQLARLERGEALPTTLPYSVQVWTLGDELAMVFLPGEVVVDYALRLKRELDGRRLWISAYANGCPCYIASRRVLGEGGYEVDGSMYFYDRPTHFDPAVEDLIIGAVHKLMPAGFARPR